MRASMTSMPAFASRSWISCAQPLARSRRPTSAATAVRPRASRTRSSSPGSRTRSFALHVHEVLVVVDVEHRLGRVDDPPDDDGSDLDRVAVVVVHLQLAAFEVADAQRQPPARCQRIHPPESGLLDRPFVDAEQRDHLGLVRIDDGETGYAGEVNHQHDRQEQRAPRHLVARQHQPVDGAQQYRRTSGTDRTSPKHSGVLVRRSSLTPPVDIKVISH